MRSFDVTAVALALGVPTKWVDNALSHYPVEGARSGRQGVKRRILPGAVLQLGIARTLTVECGIPLGRALTLAREIAQGGGEHALDPYLGIRVDVGLLTRELEQRLADASEAAPPARRGRPPGHSRARARNVDPDSRIPTSTVRP